MSHTPGPWGMTDTSDGWVIHNDIDDLATVHDVSREDEDGEWVDVAEGNAHLMRTAPDLLDNAMALFACAYATHLGPTEPYHDRCDLCAILQDTHAGIRKAEGKSR